MSEASTGRRILTDIEETSLDEVLTAFRSSLNSTSLNRQPSSTAAISAAHTSYQPALAAPSLSKVKSYPIQLLDILVARHFRATQSAPLSLSGTHLPLIYKLVATLIAAPQNKAVVVIDIDAKFDITRVLQCAPCPPSPAADQAPIFTESPSTVSNEGPIQQQKRPASNLRSEDDQICTPDQSLVAIDDLKHVHIYRPARGSPAYIREVLNSAEHFIVYSKHASVAREWWGTIVIGGGSPTALGPGHADVTTGWKGWLRVDRDDVRGFPLGMSAEEALVDRQQRQRAADVSGYAATCAWGNFHFREARDE
ncbi:hypothetical protein N0V93_000571 [Gnomoniopsis smithogilvyi]|uniref:Uncharacterized protein n=1 Tax=Gnomoniopsis smithogilvyi TaxID=1191159 RepID=A0A9W8Z023_9PEZI|nr:hypothetical protein N0V93_000571 [Gnomoniopsis smithogilvyi]